MKKIILILSFFTLAACAPSRPPILIPKTPPPPIHIPMHPKVAIALGAGGAKGYAHIGVLKVLQDAGVPIELISGASAGAIVGALYADQGSIEQTYQAMMPADLWSFADINTPSLSGFMSGFQLEQFMFHHMRAKHFRALKIPLLVATTDLRSGQVYIIGSGPIPPAIDASASVPGLVLPTQLYGKTLVDGGVAAPVPVSLLLPYQPQLTIAVNISTLIPKYTPWAAIHIYERAYDIMWHDLCKTTAKPADVIIHPQIKDIGMFDVDQKYKLYEMGQMAAKRALPRILRLMKERGIPRNHSKPLAHLHAP